MKKVEPCAVPCDNLFLLRQELSGEDAKLRIEFEILYTKLHGKYNRISGGDRWYRQRQESWIPFSKTVLLLLGNSKPLFLFLLTSTIFSLCSGEQYSVNYLGS